MPQKRKAVRKRAPGRKAARKALSVKVRKTARIAPPPPTIEGVFQMISLKPEFLDQLLTDMNGALDTQHLDLPPAERESLQTMLKTTYHLTGAEILRIVRDWRTRRVLPPPPPWAPSDDFGAIKGGT